MTDYSDDEERRARQIAEDLLEGTRIRKDLDNGFSIVDIEEHAAEFLDDLETLKRVDLKVPAMEVPGGSPVPVALSLLGIPFYLPSSDPFGRRLWRFRPSFLSDIIAETLYRALHDDVRPFGGLLTISPVEARESFKNRATDFLANRLAAIRRPRHRVSARMEAQRCSICRNSAAAPASKCLPALFPCTLTREA